MIESNDNQLKEVFGSLSKAKADVPSSSWDTINSQIKKPGFWSSSLYHFNYIYVLCGSLLLSTGIFLWNNGSEVTPETKPLIVIEKSKTNNTSYSSKIHNIQQAEPKNNTFSNSSAKKENKTVENDATEHTYNSKQPSNESIANTIDNTDSIEGIALKTDTTNLSDTESINGSKQTIDDKIITQVVTSNTSDSEHEKDSINVTTAKSNGKKIIIIEEEKTVIQTDTVRKKKRYKKKHD